MHTVHIERGKYETLNIIFGKTKWPFPRDLY